MDITKDIEIAVNIYSDSREVWKVVVDALADAAVEVTGKADWLSKIGDNRALVFMEAAMTLNKLQAASSDAADLLTSECK